MGIIGYGYGSEWHLTQYLAHRRAALTRQVEERLGLSNLCWLDHDEFRDRRSRQLTLGERRGLDFLAAENAVRQEWERLWPQSGNVHNWDAVGCTSTQGKDAWVLVEAKAHVGELASACGATSGESRRRIGQVLARTRESVGAIGSTDWFTKYYQYCNRLALLHFLHERGVSAHLLFIYFTGDRTDLGAPGRECPESEDRWRRALDEQKEYAGIPASAPLLRSVHELFLPVYRVPIGNRMASIKSPDHQ